MAILLVVVIVSWCIGKQLNSVQQKRLRSGNGGAKLQSRLETIIIGGPRSVVASAPAHADDFNSGGIPKLNLSSQSSSQTTKSSHSFLPSSPASPLKPPKSHVTNSDFECCRTCLEIEQQSCKYCIFENEKGVVAAKSGSSPSHSFLQTTSSSNSGTFYGRSRSNSNTSNYSSRSSKSSKSTSSSAHSGKSRRSSSREGVVKQLHNLVNDPPSNMVIPYNK